MGKDKYLERYSGAIPSNETSRKQCACCGKSFVPKEAHHKRCSDCMKKTDVKLPNDYLKNGYFDGNGYLREGIYKDDAKKVATVLSENKMTPTSLRAFYNKLKAIENRYKTSNNFDSIKPSLYAFERDAAYQVSRGVVPEQFRFFINKNSELAVKGPDFFKGFAEHFLSVLAYFKDATNKSY